MAAKVTTASTLPPEKDILIHEAGTKTLAAYGWQKNDQRILNLR